MFSVQEEIQNRGAYIPAYDIKPYIALILEGTICNDMPNVEENLKVTKLGEGPAVSIMEETNIFDSDIIEQLKSIAVNMGIPCQIRKSTVGFNDGGAYVMSGSGVKAASVAVPCRYIHSSAAVCKIEDYENTIRLVKEYLKSL